MTGSEFTRWTLYGGSGGIKDQGRGSGGGRGLGIAAGPRAGGFFLRLRVCEFACFFWLFGVLFGCRGLGRFWAALGVLLAPLGSLLGRSWGVLGGGLGRSLAIVGSK